MDTYDYSDEDTRLITNEKMLASKAFLMIYTDDKGNTDFIYHERELNELESTGFKKKIMDYCEECAIDLAEMEWEEHDDDDDDD